MWSKKFWHFLCKVGKKLTSSWRIAVVTCLPMLRKECSEIATSLSWSFNMQSNSEIWSNGMPPCSEHFQAAKHMAVWVCLWMCWCSAKSFRHFCLCWISAVASCWKLVCVVGSSLAGHLAFAKHGCVHQGRKTVLLSWITPEGQNRQIARSSVSVASYAVHHWSILSSMWGEQIEACGPL